MCSGCIVNNGVVNIAYHFEPDCDPDNISEEDRAEPVEARLLMYFFFPQDGMFIFVCLSLSHTFRYTVICKCY